MRKLGTFLLLAMAILWGAVAMGCGPASSQSGSGKGGGGAGGTVVTGGMGQGGDGGCLVGCAGGGPGGAGGAAQGVIAVEPPNAMLTINNGNIVTVPFTAKLNGQDVTANVTWLFDHPEIGDVGAGSIFTPTGLVAGVGKLTAKYANAEGSATVTVYIKKITNSGNLPQPTIDALDNPQGPADNSMSIAYPYPQTVFPLGVLSPEIQWFGSNPGDAYKIHVTEKYFDYTEYFTSNLPGRHIIPQADWDAIERSGAGANSDPLTVAVGRFSNGQAFQPSLNTWHIAQGKLKGNIYYWELPDQCGNGNGRILRIKPDAEQVDEFFQPGQCWGCHTVSRDGKQMMATLESGSPFPQITVDLAQDPAQYGVLQPGTPIGGTFSAFNDKGDKVIVSNDGQGQSERLRIFDLVTKTVVNDNAMGNDCGEPAWSPDGKKLAAVCGMNSGFGWMFDSSTGYISTADIAPDGVTVSNIQQLVLQNGGQGRPAYPSFSPGDGSYLAFGRPTAGSRTTGSGDLWLVETANGLNVKKLAIASSDNKSFNPVFSPLRAGGFYWLVFVSRRDYGNHLIGSNRQQLWITAVDDPPTAADPSHPPFYVRGQEDCAKSENAYFALPPCKDKGAACTEGSDCCNGQCIKDPQTGMYTCGDPPPPGMCSQDGNSCQTSADCCNYNPNDSKGIQCIDNFCQYPPPP